MWRAPGGANGTITKTFLKTAEETGFDAHGKVYAEFIQRELAGVDISATQVRLHGASKGASTVIATSANLPDEIKRRTVTIEDEVTGEIKTKPALRA